MKISEIQKHLSHSYFKLNKFKNCDFKLRARSLIGWSSSSFNLIEKFMILFCKNWNKRGWVTNRTSVSISGYLFVTPSYKIRIENVYKNKIFLQNKTFLRKNSETGQFKLILWFFMWVHRLWFRVRATPSGEFGHPRRFPSNRDTFALLLSKNHFT